jgi:maltooligosyltrehalose trehalohydrolase
VAPAAREVDVVFEGGGAAPATPLRHEGDGYFSALVEQARPGARYRYRLDGKEAFPDPASRWQPEGPHGPSEVVALDAYEWGDADWPGVDAKGQVLYEMHIGTFTARRHLRGGASASRIPARPGHHRAGTDAGQ